MKFNDLIRVAIVLATLGYLFGGEDGGRKPKPEPVPCVVVEPYTGTMTALHQTSRRGPCVAESGFHRWWRHGSGRQSRPDC